MSTMMYGGSLGENIYKGAMWGAVGGAVFGAIGECFGTDYSAGRVLAHGAAGGLMAKLQGGNVFEGMALSAASALAMMGWQAMRDWTDDSSRQSRPAEKIRIHPVDGEIDTTGSRPCFGDCSNIFPNDVLEGKFPQSIFDTAVGRFINLTSKTHDFFNGWNYDKSGQLIGRGLELNAAFTTYSYIMMPIAGIYTSFAYSSAAYQPILYGR
jgi:hypothetical protein